MRARAKKQRELLEECVRAVRAGVVPSWKDWRGMTTEEQAAWVAASELVLEGGAKAPTASSASGWEATSDRAAEFLVGEERARGQA